MTGKYSEGDRVVFAGKPVKLLDPATFELTEVRLEPGTVGVVKKLAGLFYLVQFESLEGGPSVPVEEGDLNPA